VSQYEILKCGRSLLPDLTYLARRRAGASFAVVVSRRSRSFRWFPWSSGGRVISVSVCCFAEEGATLGVGNPRRFRGFGWFLSSSGGISIDRSFPQSGAPVSSVCGVQKIPNNCLVRI
jgi:hypothetical protein